MIVVIQGRIQLSGVKGGRDFCYGAVPGTALFKSGSVPSSVRVTGSAEVAVIPLSPEWFHRVELDHGPDDFGRLSPVFGDPTIQSLITLMRREIENGAPNGRLYADSLSLALISYVLDQLPSPQLRVVGRLSDTQSRRLRRYIRERLGENLSLQDLARFVGVSTRQFSRLFLEAFGTSPHQYVLRQRLDESARLLALGGREIAQIALSLGFNSQSHFAAAFRKQFHQTPRQYAASVRRHRRSRS
jgi:AraC family transcriptional regulator